MGKQATVQQLDERYALVNPIVKDATMVATILQHTEEKPKGLIIIFTDTCKKTQVWNKLKIWMVEVDELVLFSPAAPLKSLQRESEF